MRSAVAIVALWCGSGCGAPDPIVETTTVALHVPAAVDCAAPVPLPLRIEALGDFPTTGRSVLLVDEAGATMPAVFDPVPSDTRAFVVSSTHADYEAAGVAFVGGGDEARDLLLTPLGRACVLCGRPSCTDADDTSDLEVAEGLATVALPEGGALLIGGLDDAMRARLRTVVLAPGAQRGEVLQADADLELPRAWAAAAAQGDRVFVTGGASDACSLAHRRYETFEIAPGGAVTRGEGGDLARPRADHGSAVLPDGRLLVVGGRERHVDCDMIEPDESAPLASAEIVGRDGSVTEADPGLARARVRPEVLVLDDGTVLVVGGVEADGDLVRVLEAFNPASDGFAAVDAPRLASYDGAFAVPLPGGRLAWIGTFGAELRVQLIVRVPPYLSPIPELETEEIVITDCGPGPFVDLRGVPLADGTVLLTAQGVTCIVDPGRGSAVELDPGVPGDPTFTPTRLIALADASTLALSPRTPTTPGGAALRRDLLMTAFDAPPATLIEEELAFDAPSRWSRSAEGATVEVMGTARVDVPTLRFADVEVELDASGGVAELLLLPDRAAPVPIVLFDDGAECIGTRGVPRVDGAPLRVTRREDSVTLSAGGESARCTLPSVRGRIGLGVRASGGTTFRALRIRRL